MKMLKSIILITLCLGGIYNTCAQTPVGNGLDCFTIIVGKEASVDGSVLLAHIEDDYGKQLVNWFVEPARDHHEGSEITLKNGARLNQVHRTNKYLWLEIPGMDFSDSYLNEHGVCITSNACPSKEKDPKFTDGGIGYRLRGIMAERATSAREAVEIGGDLVTRYGYTSSGRTYSIADTSEAWVMSVVNGKHWVAVRVPDDKVMVLPNNYTITTVDLNDRDNYLGSPDLISYAIEKGWYNPDSGKEFSFRDAYGSEGSLKSNGNRHRAWGAYYKLGLDIDLDDDFPFLFSPSEQISKFKLMEVLAYHYEGTALDKSENYTKGSPYDMNGNMICGIASVYGFVTEFRNWLPTDIGVVMWLAPQWPDIQPFVPYYCGIDKVSPGFSEPGYEIAYPDFSTHYNPPADIHDRAEDHFFWLCVNYSDYINEDYGKRIVRARKFKNRIEKDLFKNQSAIDHVLQEYYDKHPELASEIMNAQNYEINQKISKYIRRAVK